MTKWVQTCAVLEVVHVLVEWVRSPLSTTGMQVASRIWTVWGVVERFEAVRTLRLGSLDRLKLTFIPMLEHFVADRREQTPFYTSIILSWALTETTRYSFHSSTLLTPSTPLRSSVWLHRSLVWLRYTTFDVLYLTGAASEAFTAYATLPGFL